MGLKRYGMNGCGRNYIIIRIISEFRQLYHNIALGNFTYIGQMISRSLASLLVGNGNHVISNENQSLNQNIIIF